MKKLLVLFWVVEIVSMASADISLYIDGSPAPHGYDMVIYDTLTIQVYSSDTSWWHGYIISETGSVNILSNAQTLSAAGSIGGNAPYSEAGLGTGYELFTRGSILDIAVGIQHTADLVGNSPGISVISLWDDASVFDVPVDDIFVYCGGDPMIEDPYIVANADGPYQIGPGETVVLDGSGSHSKYGIQQWWWSVGPEYVAYGKTASISYDTLVDTLGLGLGVHEIDLRAVSAFDGEAYDTSTINIIPEPATILLLGLGAVMVRKRR